MQDLSYKERLFVEFYLGETNGNATESARRAGYRWPDKQGSQLLGKTRISAAIAARVSDVAMSANDVLARLSDIASGSLGDFVKIGEDGGFSFDLRKAKRRDKLHLVKKLKNKKETRYERTGDGDDTRPVTVEQLEIELHAPQNALHKLGQYHGLLKEKNEPEVDAAAGVIQQIKDAIGKSGTD